MTLLQNCWVCGVSFSVDERKMTFRAICDHCGAALHCCKNCKYYAPGRSNDCAVPGTDYVRDREANNFCEEFSSLGKFSPKSSCQEKKKFDDLFK
jgi:hypothetical protein